MIAFSPKQSVQRSSAHSPKSRIHHKKCQEVPDVYDDEDSSNCSTAEGSNSSTTKKEIKCIQDLRVFCETSNIPLSDETIFRYACFHSFNVKKAKGAIEHGRDQQHYLDLRMEGKLEEQFYSRALFPLPGLKTKKGKPSVFYMRPSRYFPETTDTKSIIENLCYVLNDMSNTEDKCRNGVAFIANMKGWTMQNFSIDYCMQFMHALQGQIVPTRVNLFLIVNPPSWFGKVWKMMRPMLSRSFSRKIHIIGQDKLSDYLEKGYQTFLPDELCAGWKNTAELVEDFVDQKSYEDEERMGFEL